MLIFFGQHRWTMVDLGTNDGRLGLQPPYGSLVVSSPTSSSFKSVPPWHYVILCQLPMINLKLHRSATTWPRQIIVIIDLLKLGSTILTHQSQDGSMSVFRKAESLTSVPFCRWRHILQKVYPMLVVKQWLAFPTILPEIKSEKKKHDCCTGKIISTHPEYFLVIWQLYSPGHCKPMGTVTVFKTCTACITASWKHKKFWPLPLMIWVHPATWDAWSSNNNGIKDHILYVTDVWSITA